MFVCNCNGLRKKDVESAMASGVTRVADIYRYHGCSVQCCKCVPEVNHMLKSDLDGTFREAAE